MAVGREACLPRAVRHAESLVVGREPNLPAHVRRWRRMEGIRRLRKTRRFPSSASHRGAADPASNPSLNLACPWWPEAQYESMSFSHADSSLSLERIREAY